MKTNKQTAEGGHDEPYHSCRARYFPGSRLIKAIRFICATLWNSAPLMPARTDECGLLRGGADKRRAQEAVRIRPRVTGSAKPFMDASLKHNG